MAKLVWYVSVARRSNHRMNSIVKKTARAAIMGRNNNVAYLIGAALAAAWNRAQNLVFGRRLA